jgi:hypothetical protein
VNDAPKSTLQLEFRQAVETHAVAAQRLIVLRCVPYETRTDVGAYHETIAPRLLRLVDRYPW